jgi:hypothetical protein
MADVWTIGPTAAARALRACGFSPRQAERLVSLKLRYQQRACHERVVAQRRLLFARWLVDRGHLSDWPDQRIDASAAGMMLASGRLDHDLTPPDIGLERSRPAGGGVRSGQ